MAGGMRLRRPVARLVAASNSSRLAMDPLPISAQLRHSGRQHPFDAGDVPPGEPVVLSQCHRPFWTIQLEHGLTTGSYDVNVGRTMIVRVNHDPETEQPQNGRHYDIDLSIT